MTPNSDLSLSPYPNEPLYIQTKQAQAAKPASFFWHLLAFIGPNYWPRLVHTTNRARVVRCYHLPVRTVDVPIQLPSAASTFINHFTIPKEVAATWLLVIELPNGARLVAETTEEVFYRYKNNPQLHISVDYQIGNFDGVPKLVPSGPLSLPPSSRQL